MTSWLLLSTEKTTLHLDSYDDVLGSHYSWDNHVPNYGKLAEGDVVFIWDKSALLGAGAIESLEKRPAEKTMYRCPKCNRANLHTRKTISPKYRCNACKSEFQEPLESLEKVTAYRASYSTTWVDLLGGLDREGLLSCTTSPSSILSIREIDERKVLKLLKSSSDRRMLMALGNAAGNEDDTGQHGHSKTMARCRRGQGKFRKKLLDRYGACCAICGPLTEKALDAAHLYSYAKVERHHSFGGLLLRKDLHSLLDNGLIRIDPEQLVVQVDPDICEVEEYRRFHGRALAIKPPKETVKWLRLHSQQHS